MISTQAHHVAIPFSDGSWFVSCCWGRGRMFSGDEIQEIITQLEVDNPSQGDCCADLWRRIAREVKK
jgi:hypothetical protein